MKIISLTSIPPRFALMGPTLRALAAQRSAVDAIELYLPRRYRRFPEYDGTAPPVPAGITVIRPDTDLGPASKVLHAARRHAGQDVQILFCDDDRDYPAGWAARLFAEQAARPQAAVALDGYDLPDPDPRQTGALPRYQSRPIGKGARYRLRRARRFLSGRFHTPLPVKRSLQLLERAGFVDVLQGFGGAVLRPDFLGPRAWDIPDLAFPVDDIWLSGMLAWRGIGIWRPAGLPRPATTGAHRAHALYRASFDGLDRRALDARAIAHLRADFGVWGGAPTPGPQEGLAQGGPL